MNIYYKLCKFLFAFNPLHEIINTLFKTTVFKRVQRYFLRNTINSQINNKYYFENFENFILKIRFNS